MSNAHEEFPEQESNIVPTIPSENLPASEQNGELNTPDQAPHIDRCLLDKCPIIMDSLMKIEHLEREEPTISVLAEITAYKRFIATIREACNDGPRITQKRQFVFFGKWVTETVCGSSQAVYHPRKRKSRS